MIFDGKTEVVDARGEDEGVAGVVGIYIVRIARETKALQVREVEVSPEFCHLGIQIKFL
jgi:hypothetical protein